MTRPKQLFSVLAVIAIIVPPNVFCFGMPDDITFFGLQKISENVKNTVFSVQYKNVVDNEIKYVQVGSGFLVLVNDNILVGISCEHVVNPLIKNKKPIYMGLDTEIGYKRYESVVGYADTEYDIAILIPIRTAPVPNTVKNAAFGKEFIGRNLNIKEGNGVVIIGYPLGLGVEYNENHPIIRFGIVAQYSGRSHFLIDAIANPGYSGAPVFDLKENKVIGMIQAHKKDYIDLFDKEQIHAARIPYNSGLSIAVSSEIIASIIEKHVKKF